MAWIRQIPVEEARGVLKRMFEAAIARAGRVWHITHVMSLNPQVLRTSTQFYVSVLMGESPLSRVQRELLGTVTAAEIGCFY